MLNKNYKLRNMVGRIYTILHPVLVKGVVKYRMSRRFFFRSFTTHIRARMHALFLSDHSYSPNLALNLMSPRMRGARTRARSYMRHGSQRLGKNWMAYTYEHP